MTREWNTIAYCYKCFCMINSTYEHGFNGHLFCFECLEKLKKGLIDMIPYRKPVFITAKFLVNQF